MKPVFQIVAVALAGLATLAVAGSLAAADPSSAMPMPGYTPAGALVFPTDYREWQFVTSGHGMNYNENAMAGMEPAFDNVFVQREAYAAFKATGHWPEGTMLVLEVRGGTGKGSINKQGAYQSGEPMALEVHVHDQRFKGGWAFFGFEGSAAPKPAAMIPTQAACYSCHEAHAAVDTTFVQFYPTLLPVAKAKATLSANYLSDEAKAPAKR